MPRAYDNRLQEREVVLKAFAGRLHEELAQELETAREIKAATEKLLGAHAPSVRRTGSSSPALIGRVGQINIREEQLVERVDELIRVLEKAKEGCAAGLDNRKRGAG